MKSSKNIFFGLALVLFITITTWAESDEKFIPQVDILFPNDPRSFFFLTDLNENVDSEDERFKRLRRWYEATTQRSSTFTVGFQPYGVAFDGTNIWVTNSGSVSITKLRANDGTVLGTYAVGFIPRGVVFDGSNIWVANSGSDSITKLRASDGTVLGTYAVGFYPYGVAFDGANIWVTNSGSNDVTKLRANDGTVLGTYAVGFNPRGVIFDGNNIWVANLTVIT